LVAYIVFFFFLSEKKKEKEREELWKKLEDLELKRGLRRDGIIPT
jgi:serine/threonine-protein phosphatase 2A regulatory subunit B'